jgi:acetyl esterase
MNFRFRYLSLIFAVSLSFAAAAAIQEKMFTVKIDNPENGKIVLDPAIPADGKMPAGTVITVKTSPEPGYAFDSGYYETPGAWGKMYYESITPVFKVFLIRTNPSGLPS